MNSSAGAGPLQLDLPPSAGGPWYTGLWPSQIRAVEAVLEGGAENPVIAVPTGGGKTHIARAIAQAYRANGASVFILTHRKELVVQDAGVLAEAGIEAAVYSAGLRSKRTGMVVVGGIQSVVRMSDADIPRDVGAVIVDEAHRVPREGGGQYRSFIARIRRRYPDAKLVGLTATPYRGDGLPLCGVGDSLFDCVACEISITELLEAGAVSPLVVKAQGGLALRDADLKRKADGELEEGKQGDQLMERAPAIAQSVVQQAAGRKRWIAFLPTVASARFFAGLLGQQHGVSTRVVTNDMPDKERDAIVDGFRRGAFTCLVNVNILLEGFDVPGIDLVALVRCIGSPVTYVQGVGRGMRIAPGKNDCLVLDYGRNRFRHGPLDKLRLRKEKGEPGEAPEKECPPDDGGCGAVVPLACKTCPECGYEFPDRDPWRHLRDRPDELAMVTSPDKHDTFPDAEKLRVVGVRVYPHRSAVGNLCAKLEWAVNDRPWPVRQYVIPSPDRRSYNGRRFHACLDALQVPHALRQGLTVDGVQRLVNEGVARRPAAIWVVENDRGYDEVVGWIAPGDHSRAGGQQAGQDMRRDPA